MNYVNLTEKERMPKNNFDEMSAYKLLILILVIFTEEKDISLLLLRNLFGFCTKWLTATLICEHSMQKCS